MQHLHLCVAGTVQGVGFRPFVYHLARQEGLRGTVRNSRRGVEIHVEGNEFAIARFLVHLRSAAPVAAKITEISSWALEPHGYIDFRILDSDISSGLTAVPPDIALCAECRGELLDAADRRFRYPFINCTNCGPRFTIIRDLPYDRARTTMSGFELCPECAAEYADPADRRFHAEPVACPECGPQLACVSLDGDCSAPPICADPIAQAAQFLRQGKILLVHGVGGFHLACDARQESAIQTLRRRKGRDEKPFAVMFADRAEVERYCELNQEELAELTSARAPILLVRKRADYALAPAVAPRNPLLGCLLPYSPLHVLLLREFRGPLVMTSANRSEEPICYEVEHALRELRGIADAALVHNRPIHIFADDSVVRVSGGRARLWRRARGYVPEPVPVPMPFRRPVLAFGSDLKNTFCLGRGTAAVLSQHCGDLDSDAAIAAQQRALEHFRCLFGSEDEVIACDLHPDFASTRLAEAWSAAHGLPLVRVQHHHAHLAACLAEHGATGPAVGITLDGTGYGTDGTIWGGEILLGDFQTFRRVAHLEPVPMPGGEAAVREPWRMALAWMHRTFGDEFFRLELPLLVELRQRFGEDRLRVLVNPALSTSLYPKTSSAGRLFDAVAALLFFGGRPQYEGQAAMELEGLIDASSAEGYPFELAQSGEVGSLSPVPMIRELVLDLQRGVPAGVIAHRFHESVATTFCETARRAARENGVNTVALTGGCFQNDYLLTRCEERLAQSGLQVLSHRTVPTNDGGIALGQACITNTRDA